MRAICRAICPMRTVHAVVGLAVLLAGCPVRQPVAPLASVGDVPLFPGLGDHGRPVTTDSPQAQRYFDQGLGFLYAFNHDEAVRSFRKAIELDPDCAMAWWGVAVANGPHINNPLVPEDRARDAWVALQAAQAR